MRSGVRWMLAVLGVGAVVGLLVVGFWFGQQERAAEALSEAPIRPPMRVQTDRAGRPVVVVPVATARRIGLSTAPVRQARRLPPAIAYGTLMTDPAARFTLRAPRRGVLRCEQWPRLGQMLAAGRELGWIEPVLEAPAWADLAARLAEAEAAVRVHAARLAAARASYEHKLNLQRTQGLVSQRAVEQARAEVQAEQAQLDAEKQNVAMLRRLLAPASQPAGALTLSLPRGGEVIAVAARPGELVEAGQPLLEVASFDTLLARVELPLGEALSDRPVRAELELIGRQGEPHPATVIGPAPQTDDRPHGQQWLLRVSNPRLALRPGLFVVARLDRPAAGAAVELPGEAVVRALGRTWAYVQDEPGRYRRLPVALRAATPRGWIIAGGLKPGQQVVTRSAALLLSEELKQRIRVGEEAQ